MPRPAQQVGGHFGHRLGGGDVHHAEQDDPLAPVAGGLEFLLHRIEVARAVRFSMPASLAIGVPGQK